MFYGERIKQVRELKGWTQHELATMLSVSQSLIALMENGVARPSPDVVTTLAFKSGFPIQFFENPTDVDFPLGSLLFRAHADMKSDEQRTVHRHAQMAYEVVLRLLSSPLIRPLPVRVPRVTERDPERAAVLARSELGLSSDAPVKHVISAMESAGVVMIAIPRVFARGDAFSVWAFADDAPRRRPIVVLSSGRPADRVRMTAAHELAHLVMHQQVSATATALETDAKNFASAFLMPAEVMRDLIVTPVTLDTFVDLKVQWGVAIQALIVRAHTLGIITDNKYRALMQRLSARGWRLHEPLSTQVPLERPRIVRQMAEVIYGKRINYGRLASELGFPESFVRELLEAHATTTVVSATAEDRVETKVDDSGELLLFTPKLRS